MWLLNQTISVINLRWKKNYLLKPTMRLSNLLNPRTTYDPALFNDLSLSQ